MTTATTVSGREQVDPVWALAASMLRSLERSGVVRTGILATAVESAIRAEGCVRRVQAAVEGDGGSRLPHWHDGGAGPAVVLLNGWSASGLVWPGAVVDALERRHRVVRIDNRGTGWSRRMRRPFTIADLAADAIAVMDELEIGQATVVGLSMGGMIAQELALRHAERVRHLVLLGTRPPVPEYTSPPPIVTARLLSAPAPGQSLHEFMANRWAGLTGPGFVEEHPDAIEEMVNSIVARPTPRTAVLDQALAIAAWHGAGRLRRLDVPTTVVHGEADPLVPVRNGMRLTQLIPAARYVELPRAGHLVPYEAPATTIELITQAASWSGRESRE
jgi:pimeloyl-ACP methyl ester carboxylesterase